MINIKSKLNIIICCFIVLILFVLLFVSEDSLNSLVIHYDSLSVDEVGILNVDYNKVIYTNTDSNTSNNVTLLSSGDNTKFVWPTEGNYIVTQNYHSGHQALDIYVAYGSNIYSAFDGVVTMVKGGCVAGDTSCNGRGGNYVVVKHAVKNYYTVYMHLLNIKVNVGDSVSGGSVIGTMGNTGNVEPVPTSSSPYLGTHLHFCLYVGEPFRGGYAINPNILY